MTLDEIKAAYDDNIMCTYRRAEVAFERGAGCLLYDTDGNEWLDCLAGIAVCGLGHAHPAVAAAIAEQAARVMHTSNLYYILRQAELAAELLSTCDLDKAFFCNSGAEAIECSLKLARKWGKIERGGASGIVATHGSFHGRTMGAVTVTGQPKYHEPFTPLVPGVCHVPYGEIDALAAAVDDQTAAVVLEPIQGESGVRVPPEGYLPAVRRLCDKRGALLILDEVQTGLGRTGAWYGHKHEGIVPDVMALAKSLGAGFPIGACLGRAPYCDVLQPGDHASTFGGNPLASAAGVAFLRTMKSEGIVEHAASVGAYAMGRLGALKGVTEVRGRGLMIGLGIANGKAQEVNVDLFRRRVLANAIGDDTLRILPPLIITKAEIDRFAAALEASLRDARVS